MTITSSVTYQATRDAEAGYHAELGREELDGSRAT